MLRYAPLIALSPTLFPTSTTFYRTNQCMGTWEDTSRCHPHANGCGNPYICADEVSKGLSPFLIFYSLPSPLPDMDMAGPLHTTTKRESKQGRRAMMATQPQRRYVVLFRFFFLF